MVRLPPGRLRRSISRSCRVAVAPIVLWHAVAVTGSPGDRARRPFVVALFAAANLSWLARRRGLHEHLRGATTAPPPLRRSTSPPRRLVDRLVVWPSSGMPLTSRYRAALGAVTGTGVLLSAKPFRQLRERGRASTPSPCARLGSAPRLSWRLAGWRPAAMACSALRRRAARGRRFLPRRVALRGRIARRSLPPSSRNSMPHFAWVAADRGARGFGSSRACLAASGIERRLPGTRVCDEALRGHAVRLRAAAPLAVPDGVLQLGRRPRRVRRRLVPDGLPIDRVDVASSGALERSGSPLLADYCSRSLASSSSEDASPWGPPPGSRSGRWTGPCASSARRRTTISAGYLPYQTPRRYPLGFHVIRDFSRPRSITNSSVPARKASIASRGPGSRSLRISPMFESSTIT